MQIPVLSGVYTDESSDFRLSYPRNLMPVPVPQGISEGYLRPAHGIVALGDIPSGVCRGGINWNGMLYRVVGTELVSITNKGAITSIGTISGSGSVTFDYSFTYLSISGDNKLWLYDGTTLTQVTDSNLGNVIDHIWVDGFFMTTDGQYLVTTQLNDPFTVLPNKYGSSEADPDPINAILKLKNEPYALNRYTIEVFTNIGGTGFPFQRVDGAIINRGCIGTFACAIYMESIAFVGSSRNESPSVWVLSGGSTGRIATREIDEILSQYTETQLSEILVEAKVDKGHQLLYIHLPDKTMVYDGAASQIVGKPVWFELGSSLDSAIYNARHLVYCYDKWWVGHATQDLLGYLDDSIASHWGKVIGWNFDTLIIYGEGHGAIFHELELVTLSGRVALGDNPTIWTQYSLDGESWSLPRSTRAGKTGQRQIRIVWLGQGPMSHWRFQRFFGRSDSMLSIARLEARIEALAV